MNGDFCNERVEVGSDFFTGTDEGIDTDPGAAGPLNCAQTTSCGHEFLSGILTGDSHFDRMTASRGDLAKWKTLSNSDLFANQIDSGDLFRNRVFDLQARVDFQEIGLAIFDQELTGADTHILDRVKECARVLLKCCVEFFGDERSRSFFNNLLVATLDRAISCRNDCESSERIASALGFDVTTVRNEFLHEAQGQCRRIDQVRVEIANI